MIEIIPCIWCLIKLNNFPRRIECYDISHIQGTNTVASMVVFQNGLPKKTAYRKFKVKSTEGKPDDFMSMKEVLTRRLNKLGQPKWEKPDLIIIDGGKGQLSSVMQIVEEFGGVDSYQASAFYAVDRVATMKKVKVEDIVLYDRLSIYEKGTRMNIVYPVIRIYLSKPTSKIKVVVIPTNEELVIARDTTKLLGL